MPPVIMPTSTGFRPLIVGIVTVDRATHSALEVRAMLVVHAHIIAYLHLLSTKKKRQQNAAFFARSSSWFLFWLLFGGLIEVFANLHALIQELIDGILDSLCVAAGQLLL